MTAPDHTSGKDMVNDSRVADRLLREAAGMFREKGYAASTTRQLADRLGIKKASLYHHIESKEDLLLAISMASLDAIKSAVVEVSKQAPQDERLRMMIIAHVEAELRDRDMHTTMLVEMRSLTQHRRATVAASRKEYEKIFREVIAAEQSAGRLRVDVDPRYLTLALLNLLNWTIFWYDPNRDISPSELGSMLASVFLDGSRLH